MSDCRPNHKLIRIVDGVPELAVPGRLLGDRVEVCSYGITGDHRVGDVRLTQEIREDLRDKPECPGMPASVAPPLVDVVRWWFSRCRKQGSSSSDAQNIQTTT